MTRNIGDNSIIFWSPEVLNNIGRLLTPTPTLSSDSGAFSFSIIAPLTFDDGERGRSPLNIVSMFS